MDIAVAEEQLSQAIGRMGQNVRLASELTGWTLNVMSEDEAVTKSKGRSQDTKQYLMEQLDIEDEIAEVLAREGFTSVKGIAYAPESEMLEIAEFDSDIVKALRSRARDILLAQELSGEKTPEPAEDLLELSGMTEELARLLALKNIVTRENLADLSILDLKEIKEMSDEVAAALIMEARAPWFADEE